MLKTAPLYAALTFVFAASLTVPAVSLAQQPKATAQSRPEVNPLAEVYRDDKRLNVTVVRYGKRENKQALVEIADLDHPWNQRIFLTSVQDVSRRAGTVDNTYSIQLDGKPWGLVFTLLDGGGLVLNLRENGDTGKNVRYPIYYSKELSDQTSSEFLLTAYLKQQSSPKTSTTKYNGKLAAK